MAATDANGDLTKEQKLTELIGQHQELMQALLAPEELGQPTEEEYLQYQHMCMESLMPFAYAYGISEQEFWNAVTQGQEVQFCKTDVEPQVQS